MIKLASCSSLSLSYFSKFARMRKHAPASNNVLCCSAHFAKTCNAASPAQCLLQFRMHSTFDSLVSNFIAAITTCSSVFMGRAIHASVIKSVNYREGFIGDQLVSNYIKLGCEEEAEKLFDEMPEKDLISWNSLISGYSRTGHVYKCLNTFSRMRFQLGTQPNDITLISIISACTDTRVMEEGKCIHGIGLKSGLLCHVKVGNALVNFYGKCGHLNAAFLLFERMPIQSLVSWNSMIMIHTQNGFAMEGIKFFNLMRRSGIKPDQASILTVFQACQDFGIGKLAETIHGLIVRCGLIAKLTIATALLSLYAKLGKLFASREVFGEMIILDTVAWTAMLAAYALHGQGKEAIVLFEQMVKAGVVPDHVTFVHLLSACAHSGLVNEGKHCFKMMSETYGVEPRLDHYSCMVDLLGRSGLLDDAYELIKHMPMEPNSGVWGALLCACRIYGSIERGKEVAERLFALDPSDSRNYIMLSNIYSAAGLWKAASKVRTLMKERGLIRTPGCSFIEHGNEIHRFVAGDQSHPESDKIYNKLEELIGKIRAAGFASKTEYVLHDVEEEAKEDMINKHSEKLAMAFGLLVTDASLPLIITKNLRICGDCHSMAKFVSVIEKRTIIIRDSKRFHNFANGLCTCGDYW